MLDGLAQRYRCRPSDLLGIADPLLALTVDFRAAVLGAAEDERRQQRMRHGRA